VKGKAIPKTEKNRTPTGLIIVLFSAMVAGSIAGCSQSPGFIPAELRGKYATDDPKYKDQFIELSSAMILLGFGGGEYKYYSVKRVEKEIIDDRLLYTILCSNEDEEEEFNFAFFADLENGRVIRFKNKQHVSWEKQESKISYKDHSNTQIQH
jgi:hypothetical protein